MNPLTPAETEHFLQYWTPATFQKRNNLLQVGATAREVYYIRKGLIRLYYEKEGEDISAYFFSEGMFAGAYDSFISRKPSRHALEALEDCEVLAIDYETFVQLLADHPELNATVRRILEERFVALHDLFTAQILDSPEGRYISLLRGYPDLLRRVPQHQVATFLGITPVSLSRIRKRIAKKHL